MEGLQGVCGGGGGVRAGGEEVIRDLILGDHALLYIAYVMHILAAPIYTTRWHCSLQS